MINLLILLVLVVVANEVFVDLACDKSLIFELLDFKNDVGHNGSATWILQDLGNEQDAEIAVINNKGCLY